MGGGWGREEGRKRGGGWREGGEGREGEEGQGLPIRK